MRREFAKVLTELICQDDRVKVLSLDGPGFGIFKKLAKEKPHSYWNLGVTEQASMGLASGMALEGLKPYVYSIAPFVLDRVFEQIKLDVVEQKADVKIIGYWDYESAGVTHNTRDAKKTCEILGIRFFSPRNSQETRQILLETHKDNLPAYFYLTKDNEI